MEIYIYVCGVSENFCRTSITRGGVSHYELERFNGTVARFPRMQGALGTPGIAIAYRDLGFPVEGLGITRGLWESLLQ